MKNYIIDTKSHFKHLWVEIIFLIILPFAVHYIAILKLGSYTQSQGFAISGFTILLSTIPHLIIHFIYYRTNKGDEMQISSSGKRCVYKRGEKEIEFTTSEIESLICYKSRPFAEKRLHIFPWDGYNYAIITLKDGQVLKITSLLVDELDEVVKFDKTEIKKVFFAWMK